MELVAVLALVAIGLSLAVPGLRVLAAATGARFEAARLMASLQLARSHAVIRGASVRVCPVAASAAPVPRCGGDFSRGWLVALVPAPPTGRELSTGPLRVEDAPAGGISIRGRDGRAAVQTPLVYRRDGSTRRGQTFRFCPPAGTPVAGWRVVVATTGRPRLARDDRGCAA